MSDKAVTFEEALGHWTRHHETSTHSFGSLCVDCAKVADIRAAHAREVAEAERRGRAQILRKYGLAMENDK